MEWEEAKARLEKRIAEVAYECPKCGAMFRGSRLKEDQAGLLCDECPGSLRGVLQEVPRSGANDPDLVALLQRVEELEQQDPCPKCGCGVSSVCYGCLLKAAEAKLVEAQETLSEVVGPSQPDGLEWREQLPDGTWIPVLRGSPNLAAFIAKLHNAAAEAQAEVKRLEGLILSADESEDPFGLEHEELWAEARRIREGKPAAQPEEEKRG